jgi:ABC-type multidrug transport system permease subunit
VSDKARQALRCRASGYYYGGVLRAESKSGYSDGDVLIPMSYYIDILRGIIVRGAGVVELWPSIVPLFAYGMITFVIASYVFARTTR